MFGADRIAHTTHGNVHHIGSWAEVHQQWDEQNGTVVGAVGKQAKEPLLTPGLDTMSIRDLAGKFFTVRKIYDLIYCQL